MAAATPLMASLKAVRAASWDTQPRLPYNPHRTYPKQPKDTIPVSSTAVTSSSPSSSPNSSPASNLRYGLSQKPGHVKLEETYLGYERWLPSPPKVEKPRSVYNAASLAYIGDCIYELYARRHFLFPPLKIEEYNDRVMAIVCCEAQDAMLQKLLNDNFLSEEERNVLRWGRNSISAKSRTKRRAGAAVYNRASSLETLVGYLYLTNMLRLEEVMLKLGFSRGASTSPILEQQMASNDNGEEDGV